MADLIMMQCDTLHMRLSTAGCARLFVKSQQKRELQPRFAPNPCRCCPIGAAHAGQVVAHLASARPYLISMCQRCGVSGRRIVNKTYCVSCYNRDREAALGKNRKGNLPALATLLHGVVLAIEYAGEIRQVHAPRVVDRVEAIRAAARAAKGPIAVGVPPLQWTTV